MSTVLVLWISKINNLTSLAISYILGRWLGMAV